MSLQNSHQISDVKVMLKQGKDGNGIESIEKTGTSGNVDTYTITFTDGTKTTYTVTNGESGGIYPHIIVISESGSTVTLTKGSTVITASETSTGHFEADVTEFGTWTIDAILGGDDAQVSLVVDTVKVYTVDDSHFHADITVKYPSGATCNLAGQGESYYATGSPYTFTVHHAGQYTITVVYDGQTYTETVTVTTTGETISEVVPSPSSAPANDINMWLWFGGVSGSYSSLSDILADSTALATLMASTDAVDYLVRCTNWISDICGNQSAMSYIGLNNYCANTLLADEDWLDGICNSAYFESVLNVKVPTMTSDTTPSGEVIYSENFSSSYAAYKCFDNDTNGGIMLGTNPYVGYDFIQSVVVSKLMFKMVRTDQGKTFTTSIKVQGSNDNSTWVDLKTIDASDISLTTDEQYFTFSNSTAYRYYRVYGDWNINGGGTKLQFFGREDV